MARDRTLWTTVPCPVSGLTGTRDLYLKFSGGSGYPLNMNSRQFGSGGTS